MSDCIAITLVANAGVLVAGNGVGLLVDGIHQEGGHPFDKVSEADMRRLFQGAGQFTPIDYLLFTHEHPDHFTPRRVMDYVLQRPVKGLFVPDATGGSPEFSRLLDYLRQRGLPHWTLGLAPGETRRITLADDLAVTAIGTRHMGPQYQDVRNDCFLITLHGMNLLFTGDADHVAAYYAAAVADVSLDAVFVNPIFYHNPAGQDIINTIFRPRHVVIYHMPSEQHDFMQFDSMVARDVEKYGQPDIRTHVLTSDPRQAHLELCPLEDRGEGPRAVPESPILDRP